MMMNLLPRSQLLRLPLKRKKVIAMIPLLTRKKLTNQLKK